MLDYDVVHVRVGYFGYLLRKTCNMSNCFCLSLVRFRKWYVYTMVIIGGGGDVDVDSGCVVVLITASNLVDNPLTSSFISLSIVIVGSSAIVLVGDDTSLKDPWNASAYSLSPFL